MSSGGGSGQPIAREVGVHLSLVGPNWEGQLGGTCRVISRTQEETDSPCSLAQCCGEGVAVHIHQHSSCRPGHTSSDQGLAKILLQRGTHLQSVLQSAGQPGKGGRRVSRRAKPPTWDVASCPCPDLSAEATFIRCTCWARETRAQVRAHKSGARVGCNHRQAEEAPSPGAGLLQRQPGYRACSAEAALREPQRLRQEAAALEASSSALEGSRPVLG